MGHHVIKLPDVGEGVAEAELVEWLVEDGQNVREDDVLASVMTDKATVEIPSPVEGKVIWRGATIGEIVAVGAPIIRLEVDGEGNATDTDTEIEAAKPAKEEKHQPEPKQIVSNGAIASETQGTAPVQPKVKGANTPPQAAPSGTMRAEGEAPLASPAVRKRAMDNGVDLRRVPGSGPAGRITHEDLDAYFQNPSPSVSGGRAPDTSVLETQVIGMRRKIAEKMATSKSRIPHITYVEEIDVTALEELRRKLNAERGERAKLTFLPFLMRAMARAISEQPQLNALFDDDAGIIRQYGGMHMGVAAQTDNGLLVPVVRHVEARGLWECASEVARLAEAARLGRCSRDELTGSTITITSLGAMGGIVTTPVINYPEVAIVGVNKMQTLPRWDGTQFIPRKVMNLSSSFDHRVIDGWDAAVFVQKIKSLLETPATIFIED